MRGYQKRVIYIKNTGSEIFEEAYFVVKGDVTASLHTHDKMVDEANRIINENFESKRGKFLRTLKGAAPAFLFGAALVGLICVLIRIF